MIGLFLVFLSSVFFTLTSTVNAQDSAPGPGFAPGPPPPRPIDIWGGVDPFGGAGNPNPGIVNNPEGGGGGAGGGGSAGAGAGQGNTESQTTNPSAQPTVVINSGNTINQKLHAFVITYVGWLATHAGSFFDYTIREFVIGFGKNYKTKNTGFAVESVWVIVRDVFNLTFIFGIIYIGFRLILNSDDSRAKSTLVSLLAAALLVNFSLFITKFIVDFANLTASEIYSAVPESFQSGVGLGGEITGFGQLYIEQVGLSSAIGVGVTDTTSGNTRTIDFSKSDQSLGYIFGLMMLLLIAVFVFLSGAVMVTIRFFVLLIYMIFSPIMFLGWVFPNFAGTTTKWWSGFLGRAFFAPAYVFMLYISLLIITKYAEGMPARGHNLANIFISPTIERAGEAFAFFGIATVSLLASLVIAQKMGATGATTAIAWGKAGAKGAGRRLGYVAGGATAGLAARGLRNTVGAGAHALSQSDKMRGLASKSYLGKVAYNASRKTADASFDARQIAGAGKATGIGEGKKGGFTTRLKEDEKRESEFLESLGTRKADKEETELKKAQEDVKVRKVKLREETQEDRDEVKTLREEYKTATKQRKAQIASQINAMDVEIKRKETEAQKDIDKLDAEVAKAEKAVTAAEYKYQVQYNESVTKWRETWGKVGAVAGGVAVAAGAGILTGGAAPLLIAAAGAGTGLALTGANYNSRKVAATTTKEYGKDGTDKKKSKKQKDKIRDLAAEIEESTDKKKDKGESKDTTT